MLNFTTLSLTLLAPLTFLNLSLNAADIQTIEEPTLEQTIEKQSAKEIEPSIKAQYYSADAIQAIPRLKALSAQESQYNKILFKLPGYPKNQETILEIKRLASANPNAYEPKVSFSIQDDGRMLITNSEHYLQTIISSSRGYLPGERVYYRFRTTDGKVDKEISGVPTPAVIKNKDHKVVLRAELVSVEPTAYKIFLPTMNEGEEYEFKSTSVGDITKAKPKHNSQKPFLYSPAAKGNSKGGYAILEIRRKSGEVYTIQLPWGSTLEGYLSGKKVYSPKP